MFLKKKTKQKLCELIPNGEYLCRVIELANENGEGNVEPSDFSQIKEINSVELLGILFTFCGNAYLERLINNKNKIGFTYKLDTEFIKKLGE